MHVFGRRSALLGAALAVAFISARPAGAQFTQHNLVSDGSVSADHTDANLVNPWGLINGPLGSFIIANNHSATGEGFNPDGTPFLNPVNPLMFDVPGVGGGAPTGIVENHTSGFKITKRLPAWLLMAGEDGTITGYNPIFDANNAVILADASKWGAVYKGIAIETFRDALTSTPAKDRSLLYATDFHNGKVDVYDDCFRPVGCFTDPIAALEGFAPFGIEDFCGFLLVTFAKQDADKHDDVPGAGNGYVDVFTPWGCLVTRLVTHGPLNSPWGLAIGPRDFGPFEGKLLVGNFGDGKINAFDPFCGKYLGTVKDMGGNDLVIPGLWALRGPGDWFRANKMLLHFTAGPNGENGGLFGYLQYTGGNPR